MLVIIDTSTLIAMLLSPRKTYARDIIKLAKKKQIILGTSVDTFREFKQKLTVIAGKGFQHYNSRVNGIFTVWYQYNTKLYIINSTKNNSNLRDPSDNIFLSLAKQSKANYIITGDKDLLDMKTVGRTKIVTPYQFIKNEFPQLL